MRRFFLLALLFAAPLAAAQFTTTRTPGATEKYHNAAQAYVAGENEKAVQEAEAGLALDPDNAKLKKLLDLLRQQKPPQDGDEGQQDNESQSGDQGDKDQESDEGDQKGQNDRQRPQGDDEAKRDGTQQNQGQPQDPGQNPNDARGQNASGQDRPQPGSPTPGDAGQKRAATMSAAEAQRLLDAVGAEEELLVSQMRRPSRMRRSERDW